MIEVRDVVRTVLEGECSEGLDCLEKTENKLIKTLNLGFPGDSLERIHLPMQEIQV